MASFVSEFLKRKLEERNLSVDGFADSMGITIDLAKKYLSESGRYLPSDRVAKKISLVLKLTRDEESEFLRNLDSDREKNLPTDDFLAETETGPSIKSTLTKLWVCMGIIFFLSLLSLVLSVLTFLSQK